MILSQNLVQVNVPEKIRTKRMQWAFFAVVLLVGTKVAFAIEKIQKLEGEAGFRTASLRWMYPPDFKTPVSFRVRYCEKHVWGLHRCRYQTVNENSARTGRQERDENKEGYLVDIGGLRMATNYTFQVVPLDKVRKMGGKPSQISLQTKGFSAKATKCLADSSEVVVETGPYFGGRISVEDSTVPGCFVKGNAQSSQTKYILKIRNKACGSVINGSKITTVILVQENVPILTHSTRRFVVLCSFSPESFVVQTGVNLPKDTSVAKSLDFSDLIRLSPQNVNVLKRDPNRTTIRGTRPVRPASRGRARNLDGAKNSPQGLLLGPEALQKVSEAEQNPSVMAHLSASKNHIDFSHGNAELYGRKLEKGTTETLIVFGMICAAIVVSLISLIWYIKSYKGGYQRDEDGESFDSTSLSSSSVASSNSGSSFNGDQNEPDVELDFEFSEDVNVPQRLKNNGSSSNNGNNDS